MACMVVLEDETGCKQTQPKIKTYNLVHPACEIGRVLQHAAQYSPARIFCKVQIAHM